MSRLPVPGSDDDVWGNVLNDYLGVSLNSDGTLKDAGLINSAVQTINNISGPQVNLTPGDIGAAADNSVVHNSGNESINDTKTFNLSPNVPTPGSSAQAANKAYVDSQISNVNDILSGTEKTTNKGVADGYASLDNTGKVPSSQLPSSSGSSSTLAGDTDVDITSPTNNQVLTYNGSASKWVNQTTVGGVSLDTIATDIHPLGTQSAGSIGKAADAGHIHTMPSLDQINNPTANVSLNSQKITNLANGTAATDAAAFGQIPTTLSPNGTAGGDLSGTYPNPTVSNINGVAVTGTPSTNQTIIASNSNTASWGNPTGTIVATFSYTGSIPNYVGDFRWYNDTGSTLTINTVRASLGTAPTGSSAIFDVLENGTSIFDVNTSNRPTIIAGNNTALSGAPDTTTIANGDYFTVSIVQVGSATAGSDLTLTVSLS